VYDGKLCYSIDIVNTTNEVKGPRTHHHPELPTEKAPPETGMGLRESEVEFHLTSRSFFVSTNEPDCNL